MVQVELTIDGMACGMCESHVNSVIRDRFNVKKIKSSHKKGTTVFQAEDPPTEEALKEALLPFGYRVTGYRFVNFN